MSLQGHQGMPSKQHMPPKCHHSVRMPTPACFGCSKASDQTNPAEANPAKDNPAKAKSAP